VAFSFKDGGHCNTQENWKTKYRLHLQHKEEKYSSKEISRAKPTAVETKKVGKKTLSNY